VPETMQVVNIVRLLYWGQDGLAQGEGMLKIMSMPQTRPTRQVVVRPVLWLSVLQGDQSAVLLTGCCSDACARVQVW
jgi:hypothetical protein